MQEHQGHPRLRHGVLEKPFFVLATKPVEMEGAALPEAQLDRFMFNVVMVTCRRMKRSVVTHDGLPASIKPTSPGRRASFYTASCAKSPSLKCCYAVRLAAASRPRMGAPDFIVNNGPVGAARVRGNFWSLARKRAL